jgi:DNA topoisomerase-2
VFKIYIYTELDHIARKIFIECDECILNNIQYDDGCESEPELYFPILPMILVNGSVGNTQEISMYVHKYNPIDICDWILGKLNGNEMKEILPWYRGFTGEINKISDNKYKIIGKFEVLSSDTIRITELPITGYYSLINNYTNFLRTLIDGGENSVVEYENCCENSNDINIIVKFNEQKLQYLIENSDDGKEKVETYLKLTHITTSNMWLYNSKNILTKYETPLQIMEEFFNFRLNMYTKRKNHHLKVLNDELEILRNKVKFIQDIFEHRIIIIHQTELEIINRLDELGYSKLSFESVNKQNKKSSKSYKYLTKMPLMSLTAEKIKDLDKKYNDILNEYNNYNSNSNSISETDMWKKELTELRDYYLKHFNAD